MNEQDWIILNAIFNENNLTRTAEKLYISQPALTYHIKELEKELNVKIFAKGKGTVKFTKEGNLLAKYAKKMLIEFSNLKDQLHEMNLSEIGTIKIAAGENFSHDELPDLLSNFYRLHPNISFNISSINQHHILDNLINAESHIAIIRNDLEWTEKKLLLRTDPVYLISKKFISLAELPNLPRIVFNISANSKKADEQWWKESFDSPPYIGMFASKLQICIEMVKQGLGYAILPMDITRKKLLQNDCYICALTHSDGRPLQLNLSAYYRNEITEITIVKIYIDFLKDYYISAKSP